MKRSQDCSDDNRQDDDSGHSTHGFAAVAHGRLAKAARVDAGNREGIDTQAGQCFDSAPVNILTDDILYHLFHGRCADDAPLFPPECRWVPALVCRRWRAVIASITRADAQAVSSRLRDVLWDAPPPEKTYHHSFVRASGIALMVQHGLATDAMGAWTAQKPDAMDKAVVLTASAVPERVAEGVALATSAPKSEKWLCYIDWLECDHYCRHTSESARSSQAYHVLVAAAAGSRSDSDTLVKQLISARRVCCTRVAVMHAARHERIALVRTMLAAMPPHMLGGDLHTACQVSGRMWSLVGQCGLLSLAAFLADLEQDRDPLVRSTESDRHYLAVERMKDPSDRYNWLTEAAERNRIDCADLCKRRGLDYGTQETAVAMAAFSNHVEFYNRIKACVPSLATAIGCGIYFRIPLRPCALVHIVEQPEFEPFPDPPHRYILDDLFDYASSDQQEVDAVEILRAAAVVARRWPDVWDRRRQLPERCCTHPPIGNVIAVWWHVSHNRNTVRALADLPAADRADIDAFLLQQKG